MTEIELKQRFSEKKAITEARLTCAKMLKAEGLIMWSTGFNRLCSYASEPVDTRYNPDANEQPRAEWKDGPCPIEKGLFWKVFEVRGKTRTVKILFPYHIHENGKAELHCPKLAY